jgi:hypothetical protein
MTIFNVRYRYTNSVSVCGIPQTEFTNYHRNAGLQENFLAKSSQRKGLMVAFGGLVVACLLLDPRFWGSNLADDDVLLRATKMRRTFFEGEVKLLT